MTQFDNNLSLGQYLRQQREKRGITLEQVASATKVGIRQLHALESDQYAELPAKPFIRGFVTSYSRFIGLDHKEVLTHFNSFIDSKVHERPNRDAGHSGYAFEKREGSDQSRMILGIVMGSFVILGGIGMVILKPSLHKSRHSNVEKLRTAHSVSPGPVTSAAAAHSDASAASPLPSSPTPAPTVSVAAAAVSPSPVASPAVSPSPKVTPKPSPSPSPKPSPTLTPSAAPTPTPTSSTSDPLNSGLGLKPSEIKHRIVIKATETVWVRYRVDDKPVMQFPLKKDKVLVLRAIQSIVLQLGNPEHAQISQNGAGYRSAMTYNPAQRNNDATFFFPAQIAEKTQDPFPGQRPISTRSAPAASPNQPNPSST